MTEQPNEDVLKFKEMKEIKNIYLAKKQGEALERSSYPYKHHEGIGLGYYGPDTVLALKALDIVEDAINDLVLMFIEDEEEKEKYKQSEDFHILHKFTYGIGVASGSIQAKRLEKTLETIAQLGQYRPGPPQWQPWTETDKAPEAD